MPQPTPYSPSVDFSTEEANNVGGRSTVRTAPLDAELAAIAATLQGVLANLALNQRDDGEIRDQRVKLHTLSQDVRALLTAGNVTAENVRGAWVTAAVYVKLDLVSQGGNTYICAAAHTAGTFATDLAAGRWLLVALGAATAASAVPFTATATIAATNVQAAIEEADAEGRALSAAASAAVVTLAGDLASTAGGKGDALLGVKLDGTGTASRTQHQVNAQTIFVTAFDGVVGDGATDCTAGLAAASAWLATNTAAGNRYRLVWPAGRYAYTESPNWAIDRLQMDFQGEVWLINTGPGSSFILDGGATGDGVYGIRITGFPLVYGDAGTEHGYYLRSIHRSFLQLNCRGAGTTFSGLYMEWCVSDTVEFIMNFNEGGLFNTPARGMTLTLRGSAEETSYCTFINPELSGLPLGAYFDGALGNIFIGGAVQGNTNGVQLTANAWNNKFIGTDFEVNSGYDTSCAARETQYIGCDFEKKPIFTSGAVNNSMIGGVCESIQVDAGALRTLFSGVVYNRMGTGSITDNGTSTRFRDMRNKGTGTIQDAERTRTALTVGASPYTYTNSSGNDQTVIVSGGTVSQIVLTRFAGDPVGLTSGQFYLEPGDAITVTYSSAPSVIRWT